MGIAALAATAANAEPWWGYGGYSLGWWGKSAPCVNAANVPVPCAGKRKREAEAEADPYLVYGLPVELNCKNAWGWPVPCAQEGEAKKKREAEAKPYYGYGYGGYAYGKRSADSDADYYAVHGPWWGSVGLVHTSWFGDCYNNEGEKVAC